MGYTVIVKEFPKKILQNSVRSLLLIVCSKLNIFFCIVYIEFNQKLTKKEINFNN